VRIKERTNVAKDNHGGEEAETKHGESVLSEL
jgi:hypothetical protein